MKNLTFVVYIRVAATATRASYDTFSWQWATSIEEAKRKALGEYPKNSYVTNAIQAPEKAVSSLC